MELIVEPRKAIPLILVAWLFFTAAIALTRHLGPAVPVPTVLFFQNTLSLLFILPICLKRRKEGWQLPSIHLLLLRTLAGYLNFALLFLAAHVTPLTNVLLLGNAAPFFIPVIIWLWRGIRISLNLWLGIITGFIGMVLILRPSGELMNKGTLFALSAAICFSISMIAQRRLLKASEGHLILFYYFSLSTGISLFLVFMRGMPSLSHTQLVILIILGLCSAIGQWLFIKALEHEKPSILSGFTYSAVVYAALIDWLIWDQKPHLIEIGGILVVILGSYLVIRSTSAA